jgi:hypothetical protein
VDRLNRFPQGAPPSELLYGILEILFSPREAELVAQLPIKPFRTATAARAWGVPLAEASRVLEQLASRAILLDLEDGGEPLYVLPPPMAGFFEFSMMRVRDDIDQRRLAELFFEYMNVEEVSSGSSSPAARRSSAGRSCGRSRCPRSCRCRSSTTSGRATSCCPPRRWP